MELFTSGRDFQPQGFPGVLPPTATYVRVLVRAQNLDVARDKLDLAGLSRHVDSLHKPTSFDKPAEAIREHLHVTADLDRYPIFVIYQTRRTFDGVAYAAPRFHAMHLRGADLVPLGRIRVVSTGRPTDPEPVARIVHDDTEDDAVPLSPSYEGGQLLVEGVLPYPPGRLGDVVALADRELAGRVDNIAIRLTRIKGDIGKWATAEDPRLASERGSEQLLVLSSELAQIAARAALIETALRNGTD